MEPPEQTQRRAAARDKPSVEWGRISPGVVVTDSDPVANRQPACHTEPAPPASCGRLRCVTPPRAAKGIQSGAREPRVIIRLVLGDLRLGDLGLSAGEG